MMIGAASGASALAGCPQGGDDERPQSHSYPTHAGPSGPASPSTSGKATAAYVYVKRDATRPASWENSTQQYLVATWAGGEYRDVTLEQVRDALAPTGIELCGDGWGVQEDQAYGSESLFRNTPAPSYPKATIGWPPIFAAQHWSLGKFFAVPACAATSPTATPTRTQPVVAPTPTPVATVPTGTPTTSPSSTPAPTGTQAPVPTQAPTAASTPTPTGAVAATQPTTSPAPTPTQAVVGAVLSAPDSTETAAPVLSAVLAAGETKGALAQTGAAPIGIAVVGAVLVVAGGALLVLRRRGAMR